MSYERLKSKDEFCSNTRFAFQWLVKSVVRYELSSAYQKNMEKIMLHKPVTVFVIIIHILCSYEEICELQYLFIYFAHNH